MTSNSGKRTVLMSTDAPDVDGDDGGRVLMPSAHVLTALEGQVKQNADATTSTAEVGTSSSDIGIGTDSSGLGEESLRELLPSSVPAAASSHPSRPRDLSASPSSPRSSTAAQSSVHSSTSPRRSGTGMIDESVAGRMAELNERFAHMLVQANDDEVKAKDESKSQANDDAGKDGAAAASIPVVTSTCFDVVTSSATRIPLSQIIAASSAGRNELNNSKSSPSASTSTSRLRIGSSGDASTGGVTFMALEPINWSLHHADTIFARLTSRNESADTLDEMLVEVASEREEARRKCEEHERTIRTLQQQIQQLQQELNRTRQQRGGNKNPTVAALSSTTTSASTTTSTSIGVGTDTNTNAIPSTSNVYTRGKAHDSESDEDEDEEEEDDMADAEDMMSADSHIHS